MAYLTFEILSNGVINWCSSNNLTNHRTIQYRKNGGSWTSITSSQAGANISVVTGDVLEFKGDNATYSDSTRRFGMFGDGKTTAQFKAKGNIMSLINSTDFENLKSFTGNYTFRAMFNKCSTLMDISELILPATGLTTGNYRLMFQQCTSITTAPKLPATTLTSECYQGMFIGCSSLKKIECLATSITALNCTYQWVSGVSSTGLFIKSKDITASTWGRGISKIPTNWTVKDFVLFSLDSTGTTMSQSGGTSTANIDADTGWTVTSSPSWVTVSPTSGESGTTAIAFTIKKNNFSSRTGVVVFTDDEGNEAEYTIEQGGTENQLPYNKIYRNDRRIN